MTKIFIMKILKYVIIILIILFAFYIGYNGIFPYSSPEWMGFCSTNDKGIPNPKLLWDWLDLLIIPSSVALVGWIYKEFEKSKDAKKEYENKQNETLDSYFRIISDLIIKDNLLDNNLNNDSKIIARTRTIVAIENLSGDRKGQVLQFLHESNLIRNNVVDLVGGNFRNSEVSGIVLKGIAIKGVYFCKSEFVKTYLQNTDFSGCDFSETNFDSSSLENTNLSYTKLLKCKLTNIDLTTVNFEGADLTNADLSNSKILQTQLDEILKKVNINLTKTQIL